MYTILEHRCCVCISYLSPYVVDKFYSRVIVHFTCELFKIETMSFLREREREREHEKEYSSSSLTVMWLLMSSKVG